MPHPISLALESRVAACPIPSRIERLEVALEVLRAARRRILRRLEDSGIGDLRARRTLRRLEELLGSCRAALKMAEGFPVPAEEIR